MFTSAQHVATDLLLAVLLVGSFCIYFVNGSSFVIDDDRVKTLNISPALGRGYSVKTNQFHSICLDVDETTEPSYNYEYSYTDVKSALDVSTNTKVSAKVKSSFGWSRVKARVEVEVDANLTAQSHFVMTTMRIDRYYASVMENKAPLSEDAAKLLKRKDYVGFYKACGPNYVRSIRRAQEVTAMFTFVSSDSTVTSQMKADIKATAFGSVKSSFGSSVNVNSSSSMSTLQIQIFGYGLGLDKDGSETLVATSLEDYNAAMKFAFSSMTRGNQGSAQTGMVYGIELVPWTDNTAFQVESNVHETASTFPAIWTVPSDMIPSVLTGTNTCKVVGTVPDGYEKCCKKDDMQNITVLDEKNVKVQKEYCQPKRRFPVDLLKQNLQRNGEHVAMMDSILHHKTFTIMTLERCIQVLNSFPDSETRTYLETPDYVTTKDADGTDTKTDNLVTVGDLKQFLNPKGDMASVELLNMELDEYVDMYYNPCMAALFGMNADAVVSAVNMLDYFMMKPWNSHPECAHASCVVPTNSWDIVGGGCGPSFGQSPNTEIAVVQSPETETAAVPQHCVKEPDLETTNLKCKRDKNAQIAKLDKCWTESTPFVLIERYCIPRLSDRERPATGGKEGTITQKCSDSS